LEVGSERREMIRIVPCPGGTSLIIVEENPAKSFDIVFYQAIVSGVYLKEKDTFDGTRRLGDNRHGISVRNTVLCDPVPIICNQPNLRKRFYLTVSLASSTTPLAAFGIGVAGAE